MRAVLFSALVVATTASGTTSSAELWKSWKVTHKRTYSAQEEAVRFAHFEHNVAQIEELNRRHAHKANGARFALNKFADQSPGDLQRLRMTRIPKDARERLPLAAPVAAIADPVNDWVKAGYVSPIQDQGQCGSCWAFSATSNMESQWAIANNAVNNVPKLSEQYLVDCDNFCGNYPNPGEQGCDAGCNGGLMPNAFQFTMQNGTLTEAQYPYLGTDSSCPSLPRSTKWSPSSFLILAQNEDKIMSYVGANGPLAVAVDATEWSFYVGGIMEYLCWGTTTLDDLDHGVNIVGYGTDDGTDYWVIRNSWGTDWGEDGYCRIRRGTGFCGVDLFASTAIYKKQ